MKIRYIIIFTVFLLTITTNFVSAEPIIKVRVADWPPQYFQDKNENWIGADVELIHAIIKEAGFKVEYQNLPWARGVLYLKNGKIDAIPNFSITDERKEYAKWIGPYRHVTINLIVKKGVALKISSLNDMIKVSNVKGVRFGHQHKAFFSKDYNDRLKHDPVFKRCFEIIPNQENNLKKLRAGRILGFFGARGAIDYRIKNDPKYSAIEIHPYVLDSSPAYIGISKKTDRKIYDRLESAYKKTEKNGTLGKIRDKWGY